MPKAAKNTKTQHAEEARRLFENKLVRVSLRMPKSATQVAEVAFDMSMQELMANVLLTSDALTDVLKTPDVPGEGEKPLRPSSRLGRALASADKIKRGRFATADEMFDALAEATRG